MLSTLKHPRSLLAHSLVPVTSTVLAQLQSLSTSDPNRIRRSFSRQVKSIDPEIAESVAQRIQEMVKFPGGGLKSVPLTDTWMKQYRPLFEAMKLEKIVTLIIEALIILVAAFNIASTLIMMVMEKTRDIGVL